ncbi:hypothetical protein AALO_G00219020 [Alosa alosa]|uniref:Uncharacterized protein n=1 Tax=Alosa alosa TaxID=278164 RepID=A0AAV6G121_9TELE|nr:hypothetical protein AALO_G00219020 [Alosa alosa]
MITFEGRVISEGIPPTFATGLAAVFAIYYIFNLQYQDEAACTLHSEALHWYKSRERNKAQNGQGCLQEERCDRPEEVFCSQYTRHHVSEESY